MAVAAKALAVGDPEHLADAAHAFEQSGVWLHAAEAMVSAARLAHEAGLHMRAAAAAERANTLLGRCADARTPLIMATGLPTLLTRREREVALLAAAGHSSREIAGRLRLSVRTVDNYLGRAYLKLGVSSRTDLGPLLGPR
jgi:DNA-binding CsgD family transcriptional regulator